MANEENTWQFSKARWRLRYLIPSWGAQIVFLLSLMGLFAYRLAETIENYEEKDKNGELPVIEVVWECTNVGFSLCSLVLSIVEISRMASESLTPFFMLSSHVLKVVLAIANLGLDVFVYQQRTEANYSAAGLAIDCGLLAVAIATFIYALFTYRRVLKQEEFQMRVADHDGLPAGPGAGGLGYSVNISSASRPAGRQRALSSSSVIDDNPSTSYASQTGAMKHQIDQAIGAEFGWSGSAGGTGVVGSGFVPSGKVLPQAQSWTAPPAMQDEDDLETIRGSHDQARHGSIPAVVVSGHGEEEEEEDQDRRALLAPDGGHHHDEDHDEGIAHEMRYSDHPSEASPGV